MYSPIIFYTLQSKLLFCSLAANDNKAEGCPPRLELQQLLVLDNLTWSHGRHLLQYSAPQLPLYIAAALPAHACGLVVTPEWAAPEKETGGEDMP